MAKLEGIIQFTGSLGEYSAYKRKGSDNITLRQKGGASKARIKKDPAFARTRENNSEWGGASRSAGKIRHAMMDLKHLMDSDVNGKFTKLSSAIQRLDLVHKRGQRPVQFSAFRYLLEGIPLNKLKPFDSIVRQPVSFSILRDQCKATLRLPDLIPGLNFFPAASLPMFRFIIVLGIVPDMVFAELGGYQHANRELRTPWKSIYTDWFPTAMKFTGLALEQIIDNNNLDDTGTLLLSIGIEFGKMGYNNDVDPVAYAGAAKTLGVA